MWNYKDKSFYEQDLYERFYKNADEVLGTKCWDVCNDRIKVYDIEENKDMGYISSYSCFMGSIITHPTYFYNVPEILNFLYSNNFDNELIEVFLNCSIISPTNFIKYITSFYNIYNNEEIYKTFIQLLCPKKILVDEQLTQLACGLWLIGLKNNKKYLIFDRELNFDNKK